MTIQPERTLAEMEAAWNLERRLKGHSLESPLEDSPPSPVSTAALPQLPTARDAVLGIVEELMLPCCRVSMPDRDLGHLKSRLERKATRPATRAREATPAPIIDALEVRAAELDAREAELDLRESNLPATASQRRRAATIAVFLALPPSPRSPTRTAAGAPTRAPRGTRAAGRNKK